MEPDPIDLQIRSLHITLDRSPILAIDHAQASAGTITAVVGPSGCGKSTLLKVLAGLLPSDRGTVRLGRTASRDRLRIGFVFQEATLLPWRTAAANIRLPGELERCPLSDARVEELAELTGLTRNDLNKRPAALSGGMKMRVSLARALSLQPALLLLDEPFAALDDLLRRQLQRDVRRLLKALNITAVLVTHNVSEAAVMSDQVWILNGKPATVQDVTAVMVPESERFGESQMLSTVIRRISDVLRTAREPNDV